MVCAGTHGSGSVRAFVKSAAPPSISIVGSLAHEGQMFLGQCRYMRDGMEVKAEACHHQWVSVVVVPRTTGST